MQLPWGNSSEPSPYLNDHNRLGDVIAAIQAMATYKYYKLSHAKWADRITADVSQSSKWKEIFLEHPEFFRLDTAREKASLVWRRQFPKRYNVDTEKILSISDFYALPKEERSRISHVPLSPNDIKALVDTAINIHSRALEHNKHKRWWVALAGAAGGLIGSIAGAMIKSN